MTDRKPRRAPPGRFVEDWLSKRNDARNQMTIEP